MFTERVLLESARQTITLSDARRAAVLNALLVELARLQAMSLRRIQRREDWERALSSLFAPRVLRTLGGLAALALTIIGYFLFGGARIPANASLTGRAVLSEQRYGPLGSEWSIERPLDEWRSYTLHRGDDIIAFSPITITYSDGSRTVAAPGTQLTMLPDSDGLVLIHGEITNVIRPSSAATRQFRVESAAGSMVAKEANFRARTERDAGVSEFTDEGKVAVANNVSTTDVSTGEQVHLKASVMLRAELQAPRIVFKGRAKDRVMSNTPHVPFITRIFPRATLIVEEARSGRQFARFTADATGLIAGELPMTSNSTVLQFSQAAADGRMGASSQPVAIVVDQAPPTLAVMRMQREGDKVKVAGRTEAGSDLRVEGVLVKVKPDGSFETDIDLAAGAISITITATDAAGNTTTIVQTLTQS